MPRNKTKLQEKSPIKEHGIITTDSEGGLPLPVEWLRDMGLKIGDEFAGWKEGETIILAFPKVYRGKIPKQAHRGRIEPALPEIPFTSPKRAKAAKVKAPKS